MEREEQSHIRVKSLTMAYGDNVIQQNLSFNVKRGEVFLIMGGSGSGKSTLLRHLIGLKKPVKGEIWYDDTNFWSVEEEERNSVMRKAGVLYQGGALWSSLTLYENVAFPLEEYTTLSAARIKEIVSFKLALVGLHGFNHYYPADISGGMKKRAALARAMALDPEILFFDEPSAGLDPVGARRLDDLILELKGSLETTIVVVTHELASIFAIGDSSALLDAEAKTIIASGKPKDILNESSDPRVIDFLTRGESKFAATEQ